MFDRSLIYLREKANNLKTISEQTGKGMNMNTQNGMPDYDYSADCKLLPAMLCTMLTPAAYGAFAGYLHGAMKYVWILGAAIMSSALFLGGQAVQKAGARLQKYEKPRFDPDKTAGRYIKPGKALLSLLFAVAMAALCFGIAFAVRQNYMASVDHETTEHAKGFVYEAVAAAFGFIASYLPALLWFIPDDILYAPENSVVYFLIPIGMLIIPPVFMGVPMWLSLAYLAVYAILFLIRAARIKNYRRAAARIRRDNAANSHRSRFD